MSSVLQGSVLGPCDIHVNYLDENVGGLIREFAGKQKLAKLRMFAKGY